MAEIKLGTEVDKTGATVVIKYSPTLGGSPVVPIFLRSYAALIESGHALNYIAGTNKSKVIWTEIDGKIVGHLVYDIQDDIPKTTYVVYGGVDENYQRRGLYKMLNTYLEQQGKKAGSTRVMSLVHTDNESMLALGEAVGRKQTFHRLEKDL
jgi:ribosomal protein S18 acetylase RimI-like enzyme